jgi:mono/diheme cytochrome c family protein
MFDGVGFVILVVLAAAAWWLAARSRRARNAALRWTGTIASGLFALIFTVAICLVLTGFYKVNFPSSRPGVPQITVSKTPDQIARGARFAEFCAQCHSPTGKPPLVGVDFFGTEGPPFGKVYAPNLTPAGEIRGWSDGEIIRAIREGVHKSGRALIIMPSQSFHHLSDGDVQAIVAYLRSQPAAGQKSPPTKLNVLGAMFLALGLAPTSAQPPITQPVTAPVADTSATYGKYLVSVLDCRTCHGDQLQGTYRRGPGPPNGPNLTMLVPAWTEPGFISTIRTGVDPNGYVLKRGGGMPWKQISGFATDDDLKAIYAYLHSLKPVASPQ